MLALQNIIKTPLCITKYPCNLVTLDNKHLFAPRVSMNQEFGNSLAEQLYEILLLINNNSINYVYIILILSLMFHINIKIECPKS